MDWILLTFLLLLPVSRSAAFNIEPNPWKSFTQNPDTAFGYRVIQRDASSLLVSDPLIQNGDKRGQLYSCRVSGRSCSQFPLNEPSEAVNMSLGLSMTKDPGSSKIVVCGPTIPKNCKEMTTYNGMCFTFDRRSVPVQIPSTLRDCPQTQIDIAFLLDGSGSVEYWDFNQMKNFVITLVQGLITRNVQYAVAQYSYNCKIHIDFTTELDKNRIWDITQFGGGTYTGRAINTLVEDLFSKSRPNANRVLIVITDGESSKNDANLSDAAEKARLKNIIRYAVGVGHAFNKPTAERELDIIASDPDSDYKFKVDNFAVLDKIRQTLEENIIAIEGSQASGKSPGLEFAQDGFSAEFLPNGNLLMSAVGAFNWKGGYQEFSSGTPLGNFQMGSEHDSYLGYSTAVVRDSRSSFAVLGAPRHKHKGVVMRSGRQELLLPPTPQIGAYFGAEVCVVDLDGKSYSDLLLVSSPLFTRAGQEGIVYVYPATDWSNPPVMLEGMAGQMGRFGSSLASPGDLNGDGFTDVVVGAPVEENGRGSIYIFNGRARDITPRYSQRIGGSSVPSGLRFFGLSLSQAAVDQSGDSLLDFAVGSKGNVMLFRSRPIVSLETQVTYDPRKITTRYTDCTQPLPNTLHLCFKLTRVLSQGTDNLEAKINYTLKLDSKRQKSRGSFSPKVRELRGWMTVGLSRTCQSHMFTIEPCTEDALNPLANELTFTFEGVPISRQEDLRPVLLPGVRTTTDYNLDFEINCGTDNVCIDNLKVDFNFSGHSDIQVGIMQDMSVMVLVENRGENSYNTQVMLTYPFGLSFRRFTSKQGRVECSSLDSDQQVTRGMSTCFISKPILRENSRAIFEITYSINKESNFDTTVVFNAWVASGNDKHEAGSELFQNRSIGVKYAIYIALLRHESSSIHINFTAGKNNLEKPISQIYKVENDLRDVNLTVYIRVPIKLGEKDIWAEKDFQIKGCTKQNDELPQIPDFVAALQRKQVVNCSLAVCRLFKCEASLSKRGAELYNISANVSSGWIEQIGLRAATFDLVSSATLDYDRHTYVYFSSDSLHSAPTGTIITQVEVFEEKNLLKEIVGGVVGGLLLLALLTAGLVKAGFFKSQYKQMLEDAGGGDEGAAGGAGPPE